MNSTSGVHPTKTKDNSSSSSQDDAVPLDQCSPDMGQPRAYRPKWWGLASIRGFRETKRGTHCTEKYPKIKSTSTHLHPSTFCWETIWWGPRPLPPTALTDKLHPGKAPENKRRHPIRSLLFGVLSTAENREVSMVITEWEWWFLKWLVGSRCSPCTWRNSAPAGVVFCSCIRQSCIQSKTYFILLCSSRDNPKIRR